MPRLWRRRSEPSPHHCPLTHDFVLRTEYDDLLHALGRALERERHLTAELQRAERLGFRPAEKAPE